MKILIATGLYPPESGGPATYTRLLEKYLPLRGIEVSVLPFRVVRHLPVGIRHLAYLWRCFLLARKADIILAQDTVSVGLPAAIAAYLSGKIFLIRVPGDYAWEQGRQRFGVKQSLDTFQPHLYGWRIWILNRVQGFVVRCARRVIAPSSYLRKIIIRWGCPPERIVLIHNGIELPAPTIIPKNRPKGFLIVSVGRFVPWKGMDGIIRALAREASWQATLVGEGPQEASLKEYAQRLGCAERTHFVNGASREEALGWIAVADAFILNSSYEGLSHTLIEAMSLGAPIVATNVGGNPELIKNEVDGYLIPPNNDDALYKALHSIEKDPAIARAHGAKAARRAREFSIEKTLDQLTALLNLL